MTAARGAASGKVILLGEHTVVYGAPALVAGIERGARARAVRAASASTLKVGGREHVAARDGGDLARAFASLLDELPGAPPVHVKAESDLPPGGGLGSSAALGVAIARAILALAPAAPGASGARPGVSGASGLGTSDASGLGTSDASGLGTSDASGLGIGVLGASGLGTSDTSGLSTSDASGRNVELDRVLAAAGAWERVFHGKPSGIDTTAAALGGCVRFTRRDGATPLAPRHDLWLCVGSTGVSSSTRGMVELVARLFERKPDVAERSIAGISALVENAALAIEAGDLIGLGRLMDLNQMLLAGMFVSTEEIEALCRLAREAGALGAKLTGAGGGGSVIALLPPPAGDGEAALPEAAAGAPPGDAADAPPGAAAAGAPHEVADRVLAAWRGAGYSGFVTRVRSGRPKEMAEEQA